MGKKIPTYTDPNHIITGLLEFNEEKCTRCGICASICPGGSIIVPPKNEHEKRELPVIIENPPGITDCIACGDCLAACPNKAITITRGFRVKKPYYYHRITQAINFTYPKKY